MLEEDNLIESFLNDQIDIFGLLSHFDNIHDNDNLTQLKSPNLSNEYIIQLINLCKIDLNNTVLEPSILHGKVLFSLLEHIRLSYKLNGLNLWNWFASKYTGFEENEDIYNNICNLLILYFFKLDVDISVSQLQNIKRVSFILNNIDLPHHDLCIGELPFNLVQNLPNHNPITSAYISCRYKQAEIYNAYLEQSFYYCDRFCFLTSSFFLKNEQEGIFPLISPKITHLIKIKNANSTRPYCLFHGQSFLKNNQFLFSEDIYSSFKIFYKDKLFKDFHLSNSFFQTTIFSPIHFSEIFIASEKNNTVSICEQQIEKEICIPFIDFFQFKQPLFEKKYLIYPYLKYQLMKENYLSKIFPLTHKYLESQKTLLLHRDNGKGYSYLNYYSYSSLTGAHSYLPIKSLVIPLCIGLDNKPFLIDIKDYSEQDLFFFKGAYIIDGSNDYINKKFIENDFFEFLRKNSSPWSIDKSEHFKVHYNLIQLFLTTI